MRRTLNESMKPRTFLSIFGLVLLMHIVFISMKFPVNSLTNNHPIVTDDFPLKLYQAMVLKQSILDGSVYVYDSNLHIYTDFRYISDKVLTLLCAVFFFVSPILIQKWYVFAILCSVPIFSYWIGRNFGLRSEESMCYSLLATIIYNTEWLFTGFLYWGEYSLILATILSVYICSFIYKNIKMWTKQKSVVVLILFVIAYLVHFLSIVYILVLSLVLFILFFKSHELKWMQLKYSIKNFYLLYLLFVVLFVLLVTQFKVLVSDFAPEQYHGGLMGLDLLYFDILNNPVGISISIIGLMSALLLLGKQKYRLFALFSITLSISIYTLGYFGLKFEHLHYLKPHTYLASLYLILLLSVVLFIMRRSEFNLNKYIKYTYVCILCGLLIFSTIILYSKKEYYFQTTLTTEIPYHTKELITWLANNTSEESIILIEASGNSRSDRHMYGGHITSLFPYYANRSICTTDYAHHEFLGDLECPNFRAGTFNQCNLGDNCARSAISNYYNFDYIVTWSGISKKYLPKVYNLSLKENISDFCVWEVNH